MMGCHQRNLKFLVLVFMLIVPKVHGQCPTGFVDISADPLQVRCVYVSPSTEAALTFAQARHFCQDLYPIADLINILSTDIAELANYPNFDNTATYYVGLTDAAITNNKENVIDCSAYNPLTQPLISADACGTGPCNCWALDFENGNLDQKNCLADTHLYICGLTNTADYVDVICPNGWQRIKDRCYRYYTGETAVTSFTQAQEMCDVDCGNLARVNFYDCNYAGILAERSNTGTSYLVGLMSSGGTEEWRDNSMPSLIYTTTGPTGDCFVLKDDTGAGASVGALERVSCTDAAVTQNFICERESLVPTTAVMETTDGGGTTEEQVSTGVPVTTKVIETTAGGVDTTPEGDATTDAGAESTTSREITTESVVGFGLDDPCIPDPCDNTGTGTITCVTTIDNVAECVCPAGFERDSLLGPCNDIDECDRNLNDCDLTTEVCVNNEGSFTCECTSCNQPNTGNQGVNECVNSNDNTCDLSTTSCQDTNEGYTCECLGVRERVDDNSCTDQCTAGIVTCDAVTASCIADTDGTATCQCRTGYQPIPGNPTTCQLNTGLSARMLVRVTSIGGENADYTESLENRTSNQFREKESQLCNAITAKLEDPSQCRAAGFSSGSIIAYLEVTIPSPNKIRDYEQMKNVLVEGPLNENGYVTLYTSDGKEIIIDPSRLDVNDLANYVCRPSTCQNGGACVYEDRFIQTNCQCPEGFQGTRCEAIMVSGADESSAGLLIGLSVLAVALFVVFTCCFCFVCVLSRRKLQNQNKRTFRYQPPVAVPPSESSRHYGIQRTLYEAPAEANGQSNQPTNFPGIIRNRAVDRGMEMHSIVNDNYGYQPEDYDVESFLDDQRMKHYKKFFSNSTQLNSRMSSRGDGASTVSSTILPPTSSHSGDKEGHSHAFYRPYTVDGTENI